MIHVKILFYSILTLFIGILVIKYILPLLLLLAMPHSLLILSFFAIFMLFELAWRISEL